jgi:hypothetical protein
MKFFPHEGQRSLREAKLILGKLLAFQPSVSQRIDLQLDIEEMLVIED